MIFPPSLIYMGWMPQLATCHFNMNINNTYRIYCYLFKKHHPGQVAMPLKECIHNLTHLLLQQGAPLRKRGYGVSSKATKDITTSSSVDRRKVRSDSDRQPYIQQHAHGTGAVIAGIAGLTIDCSTVAVEMHAPTPKYILFSTHDGKTDSESVFHFLWRIQQVTYWYQY